LGREYFLPHSLSLLYSGKKITWGIPSRKKGYFFVATNVKVIVRIYQKVFGKVATGFNT